MLARIRALNEDSQRERGESILDYIVLQHHQEGRSLNDIARECGVYKGDLSVILESQQIPKRTKNEGIKAKWKEPKFRKKNIAAVRREWKRRREDPGFREKMRGVSRETWKNPGFRKKNAEATRTARLDPENRGRYLLPSIQGIREDIGYAKSAWEANLLRVIYFVGRTPFTGEKVRVSIPEEYKDLFKEEITDMEIDCIVADPRGNTCAYEIVTENQNKKKSAKLELIAQQYPGLIVKEVSRRMYRRLEKRFKTRINADPRFCGWEGEGDNLRESPEKYGVKE